MQNIANTYLIILLFNTYLIIILFVLTFPAVAKYSPSGDHAIKCIDTAVLNNTRVKFQVVSKVYLFYSIIPYVFS